MFIIDDARDGKNLTVQIRRSGNGSADWASMLSLVRNLASRKYDDKTKLWFIPLNCLDDLIDDATQLSTKYPQPIALSYTVAARQLIDLWRGSIARRRGLQQQLPETIPDRLGLDGYFKAENFPRFQQVAAYFLFRSRRALSGDPTGSGKSVEALAATALGFLKNTYGKVIIICETDLREKWGGTAKKPGEVQKFVPWPAYVISGNPKRRRKLYEAFAADPGPCYLVIGYTTLRSGIKRPPKLPGQRTPPAVITAEADCMLIRQAAGKYAMVIDEVQHCKHPSSLQTIGVRHLANQAEHVYAMSATYIEGRLEELHSVFRVVRPEVFGSFYGFDLRYINAEAYSEVEKYRRIPEVKRKARPYVVRRRIDQLEGAEDVLPKMHFIDRRIILTANQRALYRQVLDEEEKKREEVIRDRGFIAPTDSLWRMNRERQVCCFPEIVDPNVTENPKFDLLLEVIESAEPEAKFVVFAYFQKVVEKLIDKLDRYWRTIGLHGGMDLDREAIQTEFQENPDVKILVTSDVWQKGRDLQAARWLVNYDLLWNPAHMQQRAGRVRRFTSKFDQVIICTLFTERTVEEYIFNNILEPKRQVMIDFMDDGDEGKAVTRESIRDIVRRYRG
jgi:superfamily II DNA or RNA helicase